MSYENIKADFVARTKNSQSGSEDKNEKFMNIFQSNFLGGTKFEKEKWHNELNPILNLWKKLNQGSNLLQMKLSAPSEQSSSDPIKSFVQLEFYNGVNLIQSIHKSMASLVKVIR